MHCVLNALSNVAERQNSWATRQADGFPRCIFHTTSNRESSSGPSPALDGSGTVLRSSGRACEDIEDTAQALGHVSVRPIPMECRLHLPVGTGVLAKSGGPDVSGRAVPKASLCSL